MQVNKAVPPEGKVTYYRSDGTGRDSYVRENNGGLLGKDRLHSLNQVKPQKEKQFYFGKTAYNRHPSSFKEGGSNRFPHYVSDGSGRDFYVGSTEGGNSVPFRWREQTNFSFKNSLRNHHPFPPSNPEKKDLFTESQLKITMREQSFRNTVGPYQRGLDQRLSEPKRHLLPPPVDTYYGPKFTTLSSSNCIHSRFSK